MGEMGHHLLVDIICYKGNIDINNVPILKEYFEKFIISSGATIISGVSHKFNPQGVSIVFLLSESHFSIHTWPESGNLAIDFYHCGKTSRERLEICKKKLEDIFTPHSKTVDCEIIKRGLSD